MVADKIKPVIYAPFAHYLESGGVSLPQCCERMVGDGPDVESVVSIGGDGTFLQASRWLAGREAAILGVNTGHLGYLASFSLDHIGRICDALRGHRCRRERRKTLELSCEGMPTDVWPYALNEVAVLKADTALMVWVKARLDESYLADFQGDGLIISTPTGSTGYNLSAGGPLVEPKARLIMLTPICPHTLNQRSIILSPEDVIEIGIPAGRGGFSQTLEANFDGSHVIKLNTGDRVRIVESEKITEFIKLNKVSFLEVLNQKMRE